MGNMGFLTSYLQSCASGKLGLSECSVAWQMLVIVALLVLAVSTLVALRVRARFQTSAG
jgi:hypothetical protein